MNAEFFKKQLKKHHKYIKIEVTEKFRGEPQVKREAYSYITNLLIQNNYERVRSYDPAKDKKFVIFLLNLVATLIEIFVAHKHFFSHFDAIEKAVDKRLGYDSVFKDEAINYLIEMLTKNDYEKLRKHDPERGASFKTYFHVVIHRLISNFQEKNNGKRIPYWVKKEHNTTLEKVYELLCLKELPEEEIINRISSTSNESDRVNIQKMIKIIREKAPHCRKSIKEKVPLSSDPVTPEEQLTLKHIHLIVYAILENKAENISLSLESRLKAVVTDLRQYFTKNTEKQIFLKYVYEDVMTVSEAGRQLGWNENQASGIHRRLMEYLRKTIGDDLLKEFIDAVQIKQD